MPENKDRQRYDAAAHAMQSGVAMEMHIDPAPTNPKHLRVGINAAMSDLGAMATLLIEKGVFTREEYVKALADAMEAEKAAYERRLSEHYVRPIKLA